MDPIARRQFNSQFSEEKYAKVLSYFPEQYEVQVPFRIAESPVFLDSVFKNEIIRAGEQIIKQIFEPDILEHSLKGIPEAFRVPGPMGNPNFLAIDFGICADSEGKPSPRLIELQGFPSLYAFQSQLGKVYKEVFQIPNTFNQYFNGFDESTYLDLLKRNILGKVPAEEVVLLEIEPWHQPTAIDFSITRKILGIEVVDIQEIRREGKQIYYVRNGIKKPIQRIYNRVIFDELVRKKSNLELNFHLTEEANLEWSVHPNWFFRFSKFLLPFIQSEFNPPSYFLNSLSSYPEDLENYVLKPLFSFSGEGVIFNLKKEDLDSIQDKENFILQKKVSYLPLVESPSGGVKAEIRLLYLWDENLGKPVLVTNLCRLSRGDMIGVKFNKERTWVGGSVALFQ